MENEILIHVDGMRGKRCESKIQEQLVKMPGIEMIQVNAEKGTVSVTGGDLDQMQVVDAIESLGYTALHV